MIPQNRQSPHHASGERPLGPRLMHRALLSLMIAAGFTYAAYSNDGPDWLYVVSVPLWLAGALFIVRGRRALLKEFRRRDRSR